MWSNKWFDLNCVDLVREVKRSQWKFWGGEENIKYIMNLASISEMCEII